MKRLSAQDHQALKALLQQKGLLSKDKPQPDAENDTRPWPVSASVQRLWLQERIDADRRVNGLGLELRFAHVQPLDSIAHALQVLITRHETLRTVYHVRDEQLYAQVLAPGNQGLAHAIDASDTRAPAALLYENSPTLDHAAPWRVHPVLDNQEKCAGLIWIMHHAVCDWFGLQVLVKELTQLLEGTVLPDVIPLQPRQISRAEQQRPHQRLEALQDYWRTRLAGAPVFFTPPVTKSDLSTTSSEQACERFSITCPAELASTLRTTCRQLRTTPYFFFLTVWVRLLQRLSLSDEVVVATTIAHRDKPGADTLAGCLSDLIPLRCNPPPAEDFTAALQHIQTQVTEDMAHAELGLRQIIDAVKPERQPGRAPLTQVMFNMLPPVVVPGVTLTPLPMPVARTDLVLEISEQDDFTASFECRAPLFPTGFAKILATTWLDDVRSALHDGRSQPTGVTGPMSAAVMAAPPLLPATSVIELFMTQVRQSAQDTALITDDEKISYAELGIRVDRLARHLQQQPAFSKGCRIAAWLPRSTALVISVLACLKAGGVIMLLDPAHPRQRQARILEDARPALVIAEPNAQLPVTTTVPVIDPWAASEDGLELALAPGVTGPMPEAAFIAFTSGSTGTPKGVVCTQQALVNRLAWSASQFPARDDDVACLKTSPGFVDIYAEMLGPLCARIPLMIASDEDGADPARLSALIQRHRVTRLVLVPTLLQALLDQPDHRALQSLRLCTCSGESLPQTVAHAFLNALPQARLLNIYGSSEVTADATWAEIRSPLGAITDIGNPLPGIQVAIVDHQGHSLPDGFPGELAISGIGLAQGYLDDPVLTHTRFRPLAAFGGQRAFLSSDLAIRIPGGPLGLLGRRDRQLKLEGVRMDAAEIESAFTALEGIRQCRVILDADPAHPRLIAALTGQPVSSELSLRQQLQTRLPRAVIPHEWLWLEALPVGPTGKIDDRAILALAQRTPQGRATTTPITPLQDDLERQLAEQWSEVLGCRVDDHHAHFFDLGGTSLKAIMATNRLRQALAIPADARWLFETPTLASLADRIRQVIQQTPSSAHTTGDNVSVHAFKEPAQAPLTFNQQWLVHEYERDPARTAYNLGIAYRFEGAVNRDTLGTALQHLADRHSALRTRLIRSNGQWMQHTNPPGTTLQKVVRELPGLNDTLAAQHRDQLTAQPFDLNGAPLLNIDVVGVSEERLYLIMVAHHAMIDGWSSERLMRDLALLYTRLCGQPVTLTEPPVGIGEIALQQNTRRAVLSELLPAYRDYVAQGSCPRCPGTGHGAHRGGALARLPVTTQAPRHAGQGSNVTPFTQALCALSLTLQQFNTLDQPLLIGFPEAGRHDPALEDSAAFLANTVLGRFDLAGQDTWQHALESTQQQLLQALTFREIPTLWLQGLGWKGLDDHSDDLQVMVVPEQDFDWRLSIPGLSINSLGQSPAQQARVDLALVIKSGTQGETAFELEYDSGRISTAFAQRLTAALRALLSRADTDFELAWPTMLPAQWAVASDPQTAPVPTPARLDLQVAEWAMTRPDLRLAADANGWLDAGRLWARANALAQAMRQIQESPRVVALCMDRSTDWLASLLAIWCAGATAVIVDPQWPEERVDFVIQDSGATLLWYGSSGKIARPAAAASPFQSAVAAIVYTSGSSGRPKGVPVRHDALIRLGHSLSRHYKLSPDSIILQVVAPAFDVALSDIAMSWCAGAQLVTLPRHEVMPGTTLNQAIETWRITHMQVPAAVLISTPAQHHPSLRVVGVGGEICPADTLNAWSEGRTLFIVYGPTEATVTVSLMRHQPGQAPGSLGTPTAENRLAIVDEEGHPRLFGMPGELLIAGPQVAGSYYGHAASRSSAFGTTRIFGEALPAYRTGDRAWMDETGTVWLLGRLDRQFKIRGQRIDPEEIEITLRQHPAIDQVAIAAYASEGTDPVRGAETTDRTMVAWVVASGSPHPAADDLRRWLQTRLPAAWIPARWIFIDQIPLNANGKTDWAALANHLPDSEAVCGSADASTPSDARPVAPVTRLQDRDDIQDFLYACWCELLERDDIDDDRSFFDYGGHSMLTVKLHERLEQATGLTLAIGEIFGHPTLNEMTDYLFEQISHVNGV